VEAASVVAPAGLSAGVEVLEERGRFDIEASGKKVYSYRVIYRITEAAGLQGWSRVEARWDPERQQRPRIEVTTTDANGTVHRLDPGRLVESAWGDDGTRKLAADVPGVGVGALVRRTIVLEDLHPPPLALVSGRYTVGLTAPIRRSVVELHFPASLSVRATPVGFRPQARESNQDGQRTIQLVATDLPAILGPQPALPTGTPRRPAVLFSSAVSWPELATRLNGAIGGWYDDATVVELAEAVDGGPELATVADCLIELDERVTLDGARAFPRPPREVLASGRGSSVERALILTGMLRQKGWSAELTLASTETVNPELPGLSGLDRGLVYLPDGDFFVDPDQPELRPGGVGVELQGRVALRLSDGSLLEVPTIEAPENRYREQRRFDLRSGPEVEFTEVTEAGGTIEARLRERFGRRCPCTLALIYRVRKEMNRLLLCIFCRQRSIMSPSKIAIMPSS
jgi:hypothetical protein